VVSYIWLDKGEIAFLVLKSVVVENLSSVSFRRGLRGLRGSNLVVFIVNLSLLRVSGGMGTFQGSSRVLFKWVVSR